jgi:branched-chain amino acid transport system ATP-binding protein
MADPLLAIDGLRKSFGSLVVTDEISLQFARGELHALIGPNGAGKTTLIHQLSGLIPSDAGRVRFDDEDVTRLDMASRARRGLVRSFQITSVLPAFSALENVALAAQARACAGSSFRFLRPAAREQGLNAAALAALSRVGLERRAHVLASSLSHGEKRLLEIAIALATGPKLLLLDEPLAGLGQDESQASIRLLDQLKRELTIILVEHDMDAVFALADRVSVLLYGRVVATGSPADIRANEDVREAYLGEDGAL